MDESLLWRRLTVRGRVQGVGFRPAVWRHARALGLVGTVRNTARDVVIEVGGPAAAVARFEQTLAASLPARAVLEAITSAPMEPAGATAFEIAPSEAGPEVEPSLSPDLATCPDCLAELRDPRDRRFGYPFLACTQCGPRYTVIETMPYDRESTSMRHFPLCSACAREYHDSPADRRFHAEATCCPACGPALVWHGADEPDPLAGAIALLASGGILAVKSLGGFHLACDATNAGAVALLRRRKRRPVKPFALMMPSLAAVRRHCEVSEAEAGLLTSPEAPIVLLTRRAASALPEDIAPGNARLGVMLPGAPLHHLLLDHFEALVMTSGNVSEEPLVSREEDLGRLVPSIAEAALGNDRPIVNACDDSVAAVLGDAPVILRRARGHVPAPITLAREVPQMLCLGSDLKNTFCLTRGRQAHLSPHLGDLGDALTARRAGETIDQWCDWLGLDPEITVHDLHPQMVSTDLARRRPASRRLAVQHHHAHLMACLAEHGRGAPALGVIWDGTGYGEDGTIWGGEFLLASADGTCARLAHLEPVPLPGGDVAIREPWRMAVSWLVRLFGAEALQWARGAALRWAEPELVTWLAQALAREPARHTATSSAGRLFDAVGVLLGMSPAASFEGEHAVALESLALRARSGQAPAWPVEIDRSRRPWQLRVTPALHALLEASEAGVDAATLSARFHTTLAAGIIEVVCGLTEETGRIPVVLSGGCFQSAVLLRGVAAGLRAEGLEVLDHRRVPPNDGGIALGQALAAAMRLERS